MSTVELDPDYVVQDYFASDVELLRAAVGGLYYALECDAYLEEVAEAIKWAERVETSAWALKQALERFATPKTKR